MQRVEVNKFRAGLKEFPADILSDSSDISVVSLDVNEIDEIPDDISKLSSTLEELSIGGNRLVTIPESLSICSHLKVLLLPGNKISHLPTSLGDLVHLEILNLSHNQLENLPDSLSSLVRLRRLTLTENNLKTFPKCIIDMAGLEFLDVSGNPRMGQVLPEISELDKMIRFNAAACGLKEWPVGAASGLKSLKHLYLSINCLESLPDDFDQLTSLIELDIGYNNISSCPDSLARMSSQLRLLHCSGNPLQIASSLQNTFKGYSNSDSNIPDEILTHGEAKLWLGPISASHNVHFLRAQRIGHIVSVIKDRKPVFPDQFKYLWIEEDDVNAADLRQYFDSAIEFIYSALKSPQSGGVLVHCRAGVSRSATIVVAFIMFHQKIGLGSALKYVLERRRVISPNAGFMKQLKMFEQHLIDSGHLSHEAANAEPIPEGLRCDNPLDKLLDSHSGAQETVSSWSCSIL